MQGHEVSRYANVGTLVGPNHRTQALAWRMEQRGEIRRLGRARDLGHGRVMILYLRLMPLEQIRRRLVLRTLALSVSTVTFLATVGVLAYGARYALLTLAGGVLTIASLRYLVTRGRHRGACLGLHCSGCGG